MANVIRPLPSASRTFMVLPSAARTADPDTQEFEVIGRGYGYRALVLTVDVTAITASPGLTVTVSGVDRVSGKLYTVLASASLVATGTTVLRIGPGLAAVTNLTAADYLPPVWRVTVTHADTDSITYSVGGMLAP
ncbi:hypothetical protein ACH4FX_12455 [Streptomyces sp. NPDC018019]|uniref:hypothetical protein n=1 Tax=Streptomyces sp. NPDC018019 TaxID=3365030 RepID=UPI0037B9A7A1